MSVFQISIFPLGDLPMADELKLNVQLSYANGFLSDTFYPGQVSITQAAIGEHAPVVIVGSTAEENLSVGDISVLGYVVGRNLDATNYVTIGASTGGVMKPLIRVKAGEVFAFRCEPGITWRWRAYGGNVKVQIKLFEN